MVFAGLSFALAPGGLLMLRGPNGSGKSSLLRLMAGLASPSQGRLAWGGEEVSRDAGSHGRRVGYLGHLDAVKPVLSAAENLAFWVRYQGEGETSVRIAAALERCGLAEQADSPTRFLSAGQRRRLALARLVALRPPLWLLDEPTTALDEQGVGMVAALVEEHRAAGGLIALATHGPWQGPGAATLALADFTPSVGEEEP